MTRQSDPLASVPLFSHLSKAQLRKVRALSSTLSVAAGTSLITEGDIGREFVVVIDGEVDVVRGDETITRRGPGEFFGEIALLLEQPRTATVRAVTDVTIEVIGRSDFTNLLETDPELYQPLVEVMAQRLHELNELEA